MTSDFWYDVVDAGYLLTASQWRDFELHINTAIWPSGIGRLPDNVRLAFLDYIVFGADQSIAWNESFSSKGRSMANSPQCTTYSSLAGLATRHR